MDFLEDSLAEFDKRIKVIPFSFSLEGDVNWVSVYKNKIYTIHDSNIRAYIGDVLPMLYDDSEDWDLIVVDHS